MINAVLSLPTDYNVEFNFQFLRRSPHELLHTLEGNTVMKLLRISGKLFLIEIRAGDRTFEIRVLNQTPSPEELLEITLYIREWFDLDTDLTSFYKMATTDKLLAPVVSLFKGYRIVGQPDLFESLTWAVIGQQINLQFAYTLKRRFVMQYGESLSMDDRTYYTFPSPEVVAKTTHDDLLPLQFSRQKSDYVRNIAEAFVSGAVSKELLRNVSLPEAKERLMKIKGIGNWTANYGLMKTFRHPDAFPLEDAGIHNAIKILKRMKRKPTIEEVKRLFKKYKGWEAYATLYLWKSLEKKDW